MDGPVNDDVLDPNELAARGLPDHVALIMDGNGRWATRQGLPRTEGHRRGEKSLFDVVEGALDLGFKWLTVYAFSTENWRRPAAEVQFIMWFNRDLLTRRAEELNDRGVRVRFIGRCEAPIPESLLKLMADTESLTEHNDRLTLQIAFNYGGQAEIVDAARKMAESGNDQWDETAFAQHLYAPDAPDVDVLVRTSGERRTSNFLIWQAAYAELVFQNVLWPDYRRHHLFEAVDEYQRRTRRFGAV